MAALQVEQGSTSRLRASASQHDPFTRAEIDADFVAVPIPQDRSKTSSVDQATDGELTAAVLAARSPESPVSSWQPPQRRPVAQPPGPDVGAGPSQELESERARRIGATIGLQARQQKRGRSRS